jgi:outer membrane protein assembly factor BamB
METCLVKRVPARFLAGLLLCGAVLAGGRLRADEWPQWRGPGGQGHAEATDLPDRWSDMENVAWRAPLPGRGWSSPVIAGDQIWMTTAVDTPATPEQKTRRLAETTNSQPLNVVAEVSLRAVCVSRRSGQLLHDIPLLVAADPEPIHALNSFASPTPVLEDGRLYCHFGANGTACLDTRSGSVLWTNSELQIKHENGAGSSPVLWQNLLIMHFDGSDQQFIVALDKTTGKVAWQTPRIGEMDANPQLKKAYGTPLIMEVDGQPQVISPAANWLYGYDPQSGRELWKVFYGGLGFSIVPRPVAGHGLVFFSTSFMRPALLAVRVGGQEPQIAWRQDRQAPQMPSPLLVDKALYMVSDNGIATCLDALSGEILWTERLGGNFSSSPIYADGKIYVGNREGVTFVLRPGRQFQLLAKNALDGQIMATPAALEHALYLRTDQALYRIERPTAQ